MAEVKKDCFAFSKKMEQCMALKDTYCRYEENCSFYKTKEQYEAEQVQYSGCAGKR